MNQKQLYENRVFQTVSEPLVRILYHLHLCNRENHLLNKPPYATICTAESGPLTGGDLKLNSSLQP